MELICRDHNATSYSTETKSADLDLSSPVFAEIITLRAIALKHFTGNRGMGVLYAEIITLRAIALKH